MFKKGKPDTPYSASISYARRGTPPFIRTGLTIAALGLFVTAAALAVVKPSAHDDLPAVYQASQALDLPDPFPQPLNDFSAPFISETQIRRGDTLAALLARLHVQESKLQQFLVHDKAARSIYKLYPGRTIQAALDKDGDLVWLRYDHTPGTSEKGQYVSKWLQVEPAGQDQFTATEHTQAANTQIRIAEGEIDSSLFAAMDDADVPDAVTMQMTDILGSKVDFIKDLRQGDRFRLIYQAYSHDGREVGTGRILALEFINQDHAYQAVWFSPKSGSGSYYDFNGRNLKGAFLRTALKFTRISSTFGRRLHPLHGKWVNHDGVDYAAPKGTPIHATADGIVKFIGRQRGYGNIVILAHPHDYSTAYGHQSAFAKGLKKGDKVEQGQVIGYVGATGWATGPHLHYEFRVDNTAVDPLSVDLPVAFKLDGQQLAAFESRVATYKEHIHLLASLQDQHIQLANR